MSALTIRHLATVAATDRALHALEPVHTLCGVHWTPTADFVSHPMCAGCARAALQGGAA